MAQIKFDPATRNLVLEVHLEGKFIQHAFFVLDTGSTYTILPWRLAQELGLKKGDIVIYGGYSHEEIEINSDKFIIVELKDILARVEE